MTPTTYLALGLLAVMVGLTVYDFVRYRRRTGRDLRAWIRHLNGDDR